MMVEREEKEKEKSNKRKKVKCKSNISDIMIKMKNAIENLEKQYTSNESQWVKIKMLQQLKKIAEYMKQIEKHEKEHIEYNHSE